MKIMLKMILLLLMVSTARAENKLGLPESLTQGGLYVGKVEAGAEVWFGDKKLRTTGDGHFVVGLNWKQGAMARFKVRQRDGNILHQRLSVKKQTYDVQHIDGLPPKMVTPPKEVLARIQEDSARVRNSRKKDSDLRDFMKKFIWPVKGRISGKFGNHRILNGKAKSPHGGMDIAVPEGSPVKAPLGGVVSMVHDLYYTGNTLIIDHGYGINTVYAHLSRIDVKPGQRLKQGDIIGAVGATGRATGPHLHWGLNWYAERLNPGLVLGQ